MALLSGVGAHAAYFPDIAVPFALMGIGAGLAFMPLLTIAMAEVPRADAGMASGIINTSLQVSTALGVAVLGTLSSRPDAHADRRRRQPTAALLGGYQLAFAVGAGCVGAALLAALAWIVRSDAPGDSDAISSSVVTVVQLRAVAVIPSPLPASSFHSLERATPSGCQA